MEKPHPDGGAFLLTNGPEARLELEAQTELHNPRVVRSVEDEGGADAVEAAEAGIRAGAARGSAPADSVELGVVEDVEVFPAEFEGVPLLESETLE